ncbi:hypothetical protein [Nocardia sp. alder85J]|uniref:hypothetical protein n=1 Tax=Nocardia sp. alder85J TaxID=2862949 RepID=UPI001CD4CA40|nr:hypothetical protein [Nocardia sp. alder85J]MCX4096613.1 hypothetical protein [Nocardia sp. alder85J]
MSSGHPLAYPMLTALGALVVCLAWMPFADPEQLAMLVTVALIVAGYSAVRMLVARGALSAVPPVTVAGERVRQQHRLLSRSWLEYRVDGRTRWLPVYFDPALVALPAATIESGDGVVRFDEVRVYPSGRHRDSEPVGRLIDNPAHPDPDAPARATHSARLRRRLLLDGQYAIAAPFAGLLWLYVAGGGLAAYCGATVVAAAVATWLPAIRGSDPS